LRIYTDFDQPRNIPNAVITTGSFDGVHIGHRMILERMKKLAFETGGETVLITFHPHPRQVLYPDTYGKELMQICSLHEKTELLRKAGLDNLIIIPFTKEFSRISSSDFLNQILIGKLGAKTIVIGYNHHFGYNRQGNTEFLRSLGTDSGLNVVEIPAQLIEQENISSVKIRHALAAGDIERANRWLGHAYLVVGKIIRTPSGNSQRLPGIINLGIEESSKLLPCPGGYRVTAMDDDSSFTGVCIISENTLTDRKRTIRFHSDEQLSGITGKILTLLFHHRIIPG
jgi:riboflavin kinase/FMN adenylyltransferase